MPPSRTRRHRAPRKTRAFFHPFSLFGSAGSSAGVELLADAFREMLADNRREQVPTRAMAYQKHVQVSEFSFDTLAGYQNWQEEARRAIRRTLRKQEFLLWITGN